MWEKYLKIFGIANARTGMMPSFFLCVGNDYRSAFLFFFLNLVRCCSILSLEASIDLMMSAASWHNGIKDFINTGFMKDHLFKELKVNDILV